MKAKRPTDRRDTAIRTIMLYPTNLLALWDLWQNWLINKYGTWADPDKILFIVLKHL